MNSELDLQVIKVKNPDLMPLVWAIRKEVFVNEQGVDESLEYEFEEESHHFLAFLNNKPVGCARWRQTEKGIKLERFAVLNDYRGQRVGEQLLSAIWNDLPEGSSVYLHAQVQAVPFYERGGFSIAGPLFVEAGIEHFMMKRKKE